MEPTLAFDQFPVKKIVEFNSTRKDPADWTQDFRVLYMLSRFVSENARDSILELVDIAKAVSEMEHMLLQTPVTKAGNIPGKENICPFLPDRGQVQNVAYFVAKMGVSVSDPVAKAVTILAESMVCLHKLVDSTCQDLQNAMKTAGQDLSALQMVQSQITAGLGSPALLAGKSFPSFWAGLSYVIDQVENPSGVTEKVAEVETNFGGLRSEVTGMEGQVAGLEKSAACQEEIWRKCLGERGLLTQLKGLIQVCLPSIFRTLVAWVETLEKGSGAPAKQARDPLDLVVVDTIPRDKPAVNSAPKVVTDSELVSRRLEKICMLKG